MRECPGSTKRPLITVGVTTYNRPELLRECVESILRQTYPNFEILIGNDYVPSPVTFESLGMSPDPRIKIVNHAENIGAWANHNFLLKQARGEWFTWLADDDLIRKDFFAMFQTVIADQKIDAVFCNYESGPIPSPSFISPVTTGGPYINNSIDFLQKLAKRSIKTIGLYGIMRREMIVSMGGYLRVGNKVNFAERLFPFHFALNGKIAFINENCHFFRAHLGSPSAVQEDIDGFFSSTSQFLDYIERHYKTMIPVSLYSGIMLDTLKWMLRDCVHVVGRDRQIGVVSRVFRAFKSSVAMCQVHLKKGAWLGVLPFVATLVLSEAYCWQKADVKAKIAATWEILLHARSKLTV
jgi:glycosyltransferase involved in cell wall biosynthesis